MSVEKLELQEFIGFCAAESEKRKWFEGAGAFAKTFLVLKNEQEKAERARDEAFKARDAALKEIDTKRAKYEADMKASLADLERVTQEKADLAKKERAKQEAELATLKAATVTAREAKERAEAQLGAYLEESDRETVAVATGLKALRAEERAIRDRLGSLAGTLKG